MISFKNIRTKLILSGESSIQMLFYLLQQDLLNSVLLIKQ